MKVLFTGGGTGGHIMPIIAIGRELRIQSPSLQLHYIGPKTDFEALTKESFTNHAIASGKMRRYFDWRNFIDLPFKIPFSFLQAFFLLLLIRPKLVFSKGGTSSLPVTFSARILRVPVFLHESDVCPGLSNRITSKWAKKTFTSFQKTEFFKPQNVVVLGNPIRKELLQGDRKVSKGGMMNLTSNKPVVLILGGSQGAQAINELILSILNNLLAKYEVIHVTGRNTYKKVLLGSEAMLSDKNLWQQYHLYEFLNEVELKNAYASASIAISRAGAGSIFELATMGKPSILIPLPGSANDHQSKNAYQYAKSGAAIVIEQESLSPSYFMGEIENVLSKKENMVKSALKFAKPEAAAEIAKEILNYLNAYQKI